MTEWTQLREGLWVGDYRVPGLPCRSTAVSLGDGFLVYSPGESLLEPFADVGEARFLLAPNNFHHFGLTAWRGKGAEVVVADGARKRLTKKGHADLKSLDALRPALPSSVTILEPPGTRVGETWLRVEHPEGVAWVIGDSFFSIEGTPNKLMIKLVVKIMDSAPGLKMSRLMKWGGLSDRKGFRAWVEQRLDEDAPNMLVTCHGAVVTGDDVTDRIRGALQERLG